jgi:hypothetical protein
MPPDPDKRKLRKIKQVLKRRGSKHRRAELKKNLADNPEGAADAEENLGRYRSDTLNGLDQDSTRKRDED